MNKERILKYCQRMIEKEQSNNSMFASEKIIAYQDVIDFINNADNAKGNEVELIKEIFDHHFALHMAKVSPSKRLMKYIFTKRDDKMIKTKLIPSIKQQIDTNYEPIYGEISVIDFFKLFMEQLPDFYKEHSFVISTITNKFHDIYVQIINKKKYGNRQQSYGNNKPTAADVLADTGTSYH